MFYYGESDKNVKKSIDLFGLLNVVPNSNPSGIKRFVSGIFHII